LLLSLSSLPLIVSSFLFLSLHWLLSAFIISFLFFSTNHSSPLSPFLLLFL
jgi:hypothetical protein